jgi:CxxC motif-containing protein (DUF1111 family)
MKFQTESWSAPRCIAVFLTALALAYGGAKAVAWMLDSTDPQDIALGKELFEHQWSPDDLLAGEGDGLGPVFNARSCQECHFQGGVGGAGPNQFNVTAFEVAPVPARREVISGVVHSQAVSGKLQESAENVREIYPVVPGSVRVVQGCTITVADFDPVAFTSMNTPALFGAGLIDEISDANMHINSIGRTATILSKEITGDFGHTSTGRMHVLRDGRLGKFGWKGQFATLEDFVAAACAVEMGLTNPHRKQHVPLAFHEDQAAKLDMTHEQFDALVAFVRALPRPQQVLPTQPHALKAVRRGEAMFVEVGCADCHIPNFAGIEGIFSDFRLHRVEDEDIAAAAYTRALDTLVPLPDNHPKSDEWKTPPLWGIADSAPYFHDGGAATLQDAILRHDLQAKRSREKFKALSSKEQADLLAFLGTLRAPQQLSATRLARSAR